MPHIHRVDVGKDVYHILDKANARVQVFDSKEDYQQFESISEKAIEKFSIPLLAFCVMPDHWYLVSHPKKTLMYNSL